MRTDFADATLTIDLDAIAANYRLLAEKAAPAECAAVVKANAYGLGVGPVALRLLHEGCRRFFVATLDEGIELREIFTAHGPSFTPSIHLFHGIREGQEKTLQHYGLSPVLNSISQITLWNNHALECEKALPAIIHIDTGMCRLGLTRLEALTLAENRELISHIQLEYLMSHLAAADEPGHEKNTRQLQNFKEVERHAPDIKLSLANSSGTFLGKDYLFDLVRPGSALYGVNPTPGKHNPMCNVISLTAQILQIRDIDREQTVGYGATFTAAAGARIAIIPVGYADGYLRSQSNRGSVMIAGEMAPIAGRVSMDMIAVDISHIKQPVTPGMKAELIGMHLPVDRVAEHARTIGYEVLTNLGQRYRRTYLEGRKE